jgi:hypothetical protein
VLFALSTPAAFAGLLLGFALAVLLRGMVQRLVLGRIAGKYGNRPVWDPKNDFDVYGIVAAILGGTGWGRRAPTAFGESAPRISVALAGPAAVLLASQVAFGVLRIAAGRLDGLYLLKVSQVVHGIPAASYLVQFLLALAVALLAAGLLMLVPLPPLDGWTVVLRRAGNRPSPGFAKAQHWLEENNIGLVILLVGLIIPLGGTAAVLLYLLDFAAFPVFLLWSLF